MNSACLWHTTSLICVQETQESGCLLKLHFGFSWYFDRSFSNYLGEKIDPFLILQTNILCIESSVSLSHMLNCSGWKILVALTIAYLLPIFLIFSSWHRISWYFSVFPLFNDCRRSDNSINLNKILGVLARWGCHLGKTFQCFPS